VRAQAAQHDSLNERVCATEEAILELDQTQQQQSKQQECGAHAARQVRLCAAYGCAWLHKSIWRVWAAIPSGLHTRFGGSRRGCA